MKIKKTNLVLFLIFIFALVLRLYAATHVDFSTDEIVYSLLPLNIISAGRLGTVEQSPLYFYLTDAGYSLFGGLSPLTARLPSILFGSLAVFVIYLLSLELFKNEKAGLISAFLFALSGYALQFNIEMDMVAFFFMLLSALFFIRALKEDKAKFYYLTAISFGLAMMMKSIVVLFVPAYLLTYLWSTGKTKALGKENLRYILISVLLVLIILIPIFAYNYLIYQEKGITDYYFSNNLGIGKTVHNGAQAKSWDFSRLVGVAKEIFGRLLRWDTVLLLFGVVGIALCLRKSEWEQDKEKITGVTLLLMPLLFLIGYIAGQTGSSSHFLWAPLVFSIFAGYGLWSVHEKAVHRFNFKYGLHLLLTIALIINILFLGGMMERNRSSSIIPFWDFVHEYIPENAIVIVDPRIYGGNSAWALNDRHYLPGTKLSKLLEILKTTPDVKKDLPLYYVECGGNSRCGWGEEVFAVMEKKGKKVSDYLITQTEKVAELNGQHHFIIYRGMITAPLSIYSGIDKTHLFWLSYSVGWKGDTFIDDYTPHGTGIIINIVGYLVLYMDLILVFFTIPFIFYSLRGNDEERV